MLVDRRGKALSLADVESQEFPVGHVLMDPARPRRPPRGIRTAPAAQRQRHDVSAEADLVGRGAGSKPPVATPADDLYLLPRLLMRAELGASERSMMVAAEQLVEACIGGRLRIRVGEFARGSRESLVVDGPEEGGLFQRPGPVRFPRMARMKKRCLLLNRQHRTFQAHATAARDNPLLAAVGLLHAVLTQEGLESPDTLADLSHDAARRLIGDRA